MTEVEKIDPAIVTNVANTILQQLGGNRFVRMTGAKDFIAFQKGNMPALRFSIPGNLTKNGINRVEIALNEGQDLYEMEFFKIRRSKTRGVTVTSVYNTTEVYCDMLESIFEQQTGLYTHL